MNRSLKNGFFAAASLSLLLSSGAALAQAQGQQPPAGGQSQSTMPEAPQADFSDDTLEMFAEALRSVDSIRQEYTASIGEAEDQEEAQELQLEAQGKMAEAVQSSGIDVPTYNMIAQQMQTDTDLQERIQELL